MSLLEIISKSGSVGGEKYKVQVKTFLLELGQDSNNINYKDSSKGQKGKAFVGLKTREKQQQINLNPVKSKVIHNTSVVYTHK